MWECVWVGNLQNKKPPMHSLREIGSLRYSRFRFSKLQKVDYQSNTNIIFQLPHQRILLDFSRQKSDQISH
jgi:hypothetical protein